MAGEKREARKRRHKRIRRKISGTSDCPRLCISRSLNHMYAQAIDDGSGKTIASASTLDIDIKADMVNKTKTQKAELVGSLVAKRVQSKGISQVVFDRGGFKYHGRVKALADAARGAGLRF